MKFLNFEESKQELRRLYKENKLLKEENDKLAGQNISYWWKNEKLKREIERLKEPKAIINVNVTPEYLAKEVARALNKTEKQEHKCTSECFGEHVIKAIQKDYESCPVVFKATFIKYWYDNLSAFYPWLESLYIIDEKIYFKSKESSI